MNQLAPPTPGTPWGLLRQQTEPAIRTDAVYVVHTSTDDTLVAVRVASDFASALGVPVTLVHFRTVPYALPVDAPCGISPVQTDAFIRHLRAENLELRVRVCLCRNEREAFPLAFKRYSLIVIAGRPRQSEQRLRRLEAAGHLVVFVDTSERGARGMPQASSGAARSVGWAHGRPEFVERRAGPAVALGQEKKENSHA